MTAERWSYMNCYHFSSKSSHHQTLLSSSSSSEKGKQASSDYKVFLFRNRPPPLPASGLWPCSLAPASKNIRSSFKKRVLEVPVPRWHAAAFQTPIHIPEPARSARSTSISCFLARRHGRGPRRPPG